jgi:hypothetical protein
VVPRRGWDERLDEYVRFLQEQNRAPSQYAEDADERVLHFWLRHQSASLRNGLLVPEKAAKLDELVPGWNSPHRLRLSWDEMLTRTVQFKAQRGRWPSALSSDSDERALANWLYRQTKHAGRAAKLDSALLNWRRRPSGDTERWNTRLEGVLEHVRRYGRLPAMGSATPPEEYALGKWLSVQRYALKKGTLYPERLARLDELLPGWRRLGG